jgi:hypothetical protein
MRPKNNELHGKNDNWKEEKQEEQKKQKQKLPLLQKRKNKRW